MKLLLISLLFFIFEFSAKAQTNRTVMVNSDGVVIYSGTNPLTFTNTVTFDGGINVVDLVAHQANYLRDQESGNSVLYYTFDIDPKWTISAPDHFLGALFGYGANSYSFDEWTRDNLRAKSSLSVIDRGDADATVLYYDSSSTNKWFISDVSAFRAQLGVSSGGGGSNGVVDLSSTNVMGVLPITKGGTGATNAIGIRQALGVQTYANTLNNSVNNVEIGSTVSNVTLTWTISPTNGFYAVRTLIGASQTNNITNNSSSLVRSNLALTSNTTWTLTVGDGFGVTNTATTSVNFLNYMTWGRSTNASLNNTNIQTLHDTQGGASRALATSRARTIIMDGGGQYLYIAYPQNFGSASFVVGGLPNSAFTSFTNSYTNASGYVTNYLIYRTDTIQNGTGITIIVQ